MDRSSSEGRVQVMFGNMPSSIEHIRGWPSFRPLARKHGRQLRSEALPDLPPVGDFVPGYEAEQAWQRPWRARGTRARRNRRHSSTKRSTRRFPLTPRSRQGSPIWAGIPCLGRARPPISEGSSPTKNREMGQGGSGQANIKPQSGVTSSRSADFPNVSRSAN